MWSKIKGWFKKDKQMSVVDRAEPLCKSPAKQKVGKSSQVSSGVYTSAPSPTSSTIQDSALTYLVLDSLSTPSYSSTVNQDVKAEPVQTITPEPAQSYTSDSYTSSSRYDSSDYSSSSYSSSSDSGSSYSSDSSSSSSYSSD